MKHCPPLAWERKEINTGQVIYYQFLSMLSPLRKTHRYQVGFACFSNAVFFRLANPRGPQNRKTGRGSAQDDNFYSSIT